MTSTVAREKGFQPRLFTMFYAVIFFNLLFQQVENINNYYQGSDRLICCFNSLTVPKQEPG